MKFNNTLFIAAIVILIGFGIIAAALLNQPRELLIAMILAGLAFVFSGYIQIAQAYDNNKKDKQNEGKHQQIMEKLEKMEQALEKAEEEKSKGSGVAIADILGAGIKYYTEHLSQPKEEEKQDD